MGKEILFLSFVTELSAHSSTKMRCSHFKLEIQSGQFRDQWARFIHFQVQFRFGLNNRLNTAADLANPLMFDIRKPTMLSKRDQNGNFSPIYRGAIWLRIYARTRYRHPQSDCRMCARLKRDLGPETQ